MLVAARPFSIDAEPAFQVGLDGYAAHCVLGPCATLIEAASRTIRVSARPKPRIWVESGAVAKGAKGLLLSSRSSLGIEFGELDSEEFDLAVSIGGREEIIALTMSPEGGYTIHDLSNHLQGGDDLVPVKTELRLRGSNRALVRYKAWLWPSLREIRDGLVFDSDNIPANYSPDRSHHIVTDHTGQLCLDNDAVVRHGFETPGCACSGGQG